MSLQRTLLAVLAVFFVAAPARADFAEVSGPGETPFLLSKQQAWTWEDLAGQGISSITYAVYRSTTPDGGFTAVRDGYLAPSWDGDLDLPSAQGASLYHYLVTANDQSGDDSPGDRSDGGLREVELPPRCGSGAAPLQEAVPLRAERFPVSFFTPTFLTHEPSRPADLYLVDRFGSVQLFREGAFLGTPFLDIGARVRTGSERGLLGFAFHPEFETNGRVFVHYSSSAITNCGVLDRDHCAVVSEFTLSGDPDVIDAGSERVLLVVGEPNGNHDGGWIGFSPIDGDHLYIAFGDGGGGGDPDETGQDPTLLLGSMLRIQPEPDLAAGTEYTIPADNPFVGHPTNREEIFAWGLRNPWRNSFDRETGDFYIADVGQNLWEEVNVATAASGSGNGANYGWNNMEGTHCFDPTPGCDMTGITLPVIEYPHEGAFCSGSITGGYVYRGCRMPFLSGEYFFADYCLNRISSFNFEAGGMATLQLDRSDLGGPGAVVSFGEDADGELWILEAGGTVWRILPDF